ncbi:MAG: TetR/AcrR family transcriptional regulator [Actinomycetota bacterium]
MVDPHVIERRTQAERSATTRTALLAAATEIILRDGNADVRLVEVAAHAGLTKGAIQHHFATKTELLAALVEAGWRDLIRRLDGEEPGRQSIDDRIDRLIDTMWASYSGPATMAAYTIALTLGHEPELRRLHEHAFRAARDTLERQWAEAFDDLGIPPDDLRRARRFARTHIAGIIAHLRIDPDAPPAAVQLATLKAAIGDILTKGNARSGGPV